MSTEEFAPHVLREYALLADGQRGALIGPRGEISWMCAPNWHDDAVFASLIGGPGIFAITPSRRFVWGGHYEEGSLIWRSRWVTADGILECREALSFPASSDRLVLLRRVEAISGDAEAKLVFSPAAGFGRHGMRDLSRDEHGDWHAQVGDLAMTLRGASDAEPASGVATPELRGVIRVPEGGRHDVVLELRKRSCREQLPSITELWQETESRWDATLPSYSDSIAPRDTRHAHAVLRGLTANSGGMVAAATMSMPERANQGRNYDYRYVWIRDQCYAGQAVAAAGQHELLDGAVAFVAERVLEDGPELKPAYTIAGGPVPDERSLRLSGYPGGSDIVGNHANKQFQLDALGEALQLFAAAAGHDRLDSHSYSAAVAAVEAISKRWREPDAGIWELDDKRWAHSRLSCVAGLNAMATHAVGADVGKWTELADTILADAADCVHPTGRWQRAPDDPRLDAALLQAGIRGAIPREDPRHLATLAAVRRELADDGFVYRFRHDNPSRSLGATEGAFALCGFWMALATHQLGDDVAAARYFERNRTACGPPGLLSEEFDVEQRQLRGNIPQAFVHALLIESSVRLAKPPAKSS
ncbi:glycoside hydrolase family 15 protein [Mycolicibacterium moriokaense]|nr:glycoside hydrolase family 15 protein [Mycolicibacterium moriokaense]